jgi:uncharacterized membrane-anchored protein
MVAIFGTMEADALHIQLGVAYAVSTVGFAVALTAIFIVWYGTERTLSIHHITTLRRELFCWATVCATFALGTAAGDLTAYTLHLGFLASGMLFAVVIAVPALAHRFARLDAVVAFWFAYIITRPLGASFADWMGVPHTLGGLNWGRGTVSVSFTIVIACLVAYLTVTRVDVEEEQRVSGSGIWPERGGVSSGPPCDQPVKGLQPPLQKPIDRLGHGRPDLHVVASYPRPSLRRPH